MYPRILSEWWRKCHILGESLKSFSSPKMDIIISIKLAGLFVRPWGMLLYSGRLNREGKCCVSFVILVQCTVGPSCVEVCRAGHPLGGLCQQNPSPRHSPFCASRRWIDIAQWSTAAYLSLSLAVTILFGIASPFHHVCRTAEIPNRANSYSQFTIYWRESLSFVKWATWWCCCQEYFHRFGLAQLKQQWSLHSDKLIQWCHLWQNVWQSDLSCQC